MGGVARGHKNDWDYFNRKAGATPGTASRLLNIYRRI